MGKAVDIDLGTALSASNDGALNLELANSTVTGGGR
jgi:hypothetical protein